MIIKIEPSPHFYDGFCDHTRYNARSSCVLVAMKVSRDDYVSYNRYGNLQEIHRIETDDSVIDASAGKRKIDNRK